MVDISPYLGTIATIIIAFGGFYGMVSTRLAKTETKLDDLKDQVEKHNNVIERTYKLEVDMATAYKQIDELKAQDAKLEAKIEGR